MAKKYKVPTGVQTSESERRAQERVWRQIFRDQGISGLTHVAFCHKYSIPRHRYFWWKREIKKRRRRGKAEASSRTPRKAKSKPARNGLVPVCVVESRSSAEAGSSFEIVLRNGRVLRIPQQFDREALSSLLSLLENSC